MERENCRNGVAGRDVSEVLFVQFYPIQIWEHRRDPPGRSADRIPQQTPKKSSRSERQDPGARLAEVQFAGGKWKGLEYH